MAEGFIFWMIILHCVNYQRRHFKKDAYIFPIKDALMFIPAAPFGFNGIAFMGARFFAAPNPEVGAVFTYYIKDEYKSLKEKRRDTEKEKQKKGEDIDFPYIQYIKKGK